MNIGIEALSFYSSHYYIGLAELATHRGVDPAKFSEGIWQKRMAVPCPGEDVVTLAANAAKQALEGIDTDAITTLVFATETGIDQSKAAGIYVHKLLGLSKRCRVFETKQACYGATGVLQLARAYVAMHPGEKALIIASDIARYGLGTPGESTQGGGAVAMVISSDPKLLAFDDECGFCVEDVMDFWRPNYRSEALVDGKASVKIYIRCLHECWRQYQEQSGRNIDDFTRICYHLPFSRMAVTAHQRLLRSAGIRKGTADIEALVKDSVIYNQEIGNSYTASMYIGLCSLLEHCEEDLAGAQIGLFSYGSGCMAEFFSGRVMPDYKQYLKTELHENMLASREIASFDSYEAAYNFSLPTDGSELEIPVDKTGAFRLSGMREHMRIYEPVC